MTFDVVGCHPPDVWCKWVRAGKSAHVNCGALTELVDEEREGQQVGMCYHNVSGCGAHGTCDKYRGLLMYPRELSDSPNGATATSCTCWFADWCDESVNCIEHARNHNHQIEAMDKGGGQAVL